MVNTDVTLESRTRDRVLRVVSQEGPVSITTLVERLGLPAAPFAGDPVEPGTTIGPVLDGHDGPAGTPADTD